mgnify:CR=1 FL=1
MKKFGKGLHRVYVGLVLLFLYAPILVMVAFSFSSGKSRANWGGFTLDWYKELFSSGPIMEALGNTVAIAVIAALVSTFVGTVAAIGIHGLGNRSRNVILDITYIPMLNPDIVTGISLMILFIFMRMELGFFTMLLAHISFDIPYVIFSVMPRLEQMDNNLYEAALDLGATPIQAVKKVILPEIMPGVMTGLIMAFTLSIDDFVISFFTTSGVQNLSIYIYSSARKGIEPTVYALMALMFVVVLALLLIANRRSFRDQSKVARRI